jgi:hypothetical protein
MTPDPPARMMPCGNIVSNRHKRTLLTTRGYRAKRPLMRLCSLSFAHVAHGLMFHALVESRQTMILTLRNPMFWDKKVRIAMLTLVTFIALC